MEVPKRLEFKDAAAFLGCGDCTLRRLIKSGLLEGTYFNIGSKRIFFADRLQKWMEDGGEDAARERRRQA